VARAHVAGRTGGAAVTGYLVRRLFQALVVLFLVMLFTFWLQRLVPGGVTRAVIDNPRATPQEIAYYTHLYGFDRPIYVQFGKWAWQLLHGNLGYSFKNNLTVSGELVLYLPKTIVLVLLGTITSLVFGIPLGVYQAVKRYTLGDYVLTGVSFVGYAIPTFFIALLLVSWFAIDIKLFPPFAPQEDTILGVLGDPLSFVLPVAAFAFGLYALWSRYTRSSVMDNLVQDYVRTARAKGASEWRVLRGHVFRNSLMSIITLLGLSLPALIAGDLFIEVVFNYPGMGLAFYNAALTVDYQVLFGFTLIATLAIIAGNLLADIAYAVLDPRVRYN
jgi:peptide/nickel transport system permease protein